MFRLFIKRNIQWTIRFLLSVGMTLPWWVQGEYVCGPATAILSPLIKKRLSFRAERGIFSGRKGVLILEIQQGSNVSPSHQKEYTVDN